MQQVVADSVRREFDFHKFGVNPKAVVKVGSWQTLHGPADYADVENVVISVVRSLKVNDRACGVLVAVVIKLTQFNSAMSEILNS